jgi:hypothetical protein
MPAYFHSHPGLGQIMVVVYAIVGIPLMLMFLANMGEVMARAFRIAYGKG